MLTQATTVLVAIAWYTSTEVMLQHYISSHWLLMEELHLARPLYNCETVINGYRFDRFWLRHLRRLFPNPSSAYLNDQSATGRLMSLYQKVSVAEVLLTVFLRPDRLEWGYNATLVHILGEMHEILFAVRTSELQLATSNLVLST